MSIAAPVLSNRRTTACIAACVLALTVPVAQAQTLYKYKDESGRWVYTDREPIDAEDVEVEVLGRTELKPEARFLREMDEEAGLLTLRVANSCFCPIELLAELTLAEGIEGPEGRVKRVIAARSTVALAGFTGPGVGRDSVDARLGFVLGDPDAEHTAPEPGYRLPFAPAKSYRVTQTYPDSKTHRTPDSLYAIDLAMPEGSGVYTARAGIVVEVAHQNFTGGTDLEKFGTKANRVRVLHDDGTFSVYGHLSWDSIRVRPGDQVVRGQYIANSGDTGYSSGPHLHFAVLRNAGLHLESVPVQFVDAQSEAITLRSGGDVGPP